MTIEIPERLRNEAFRFILLNGKVAKEKSWNTEKNYLWNNPKIINHKGNLGILCGINHLAVIDCDSIEFSNHVENNLPKTFRIKTGSGNNHFYYIIKDLDRKIIVKDKEKHYGEVQFKGQYVVCPNCIHPNGNKYTILEDIKIAEINKQSLNECISKLIFDTEVFPISKEYDSLEIKKFVEAISSSYPKEGSRQDTTLAYVSFLRRDLGFGIETCKKIIRQVCNITNDTEIEMRLNCVNSAFSLNEDKIVGHNRLRSISPEIYENLVKIKDSSIEFSDYDETIDELGRTCRDILSSKNPDKNQVTEKIVKFLERKHKFYSIRDDNTDEIYAYSNGVYRKNGRSYIDEINRKILKVAYSIQISNRIIDKIRADSYIDLEQFFNSESRNEIVLENGILNVLTKELSEYDSNKIFFGKLPIKYDPKATCPKTIEFLEEILDCKDDVKIIQEFFGYCLYKDYSIRKALMLIGIGKNGKSQLTNLLRTFLGDENISALPLISFQGKFDLYELQGKLANIGGDIGKQSLENTEFFKMSTGNDVIRSDRKFLKSIKFKNHAKQIFACNELPRIGEDTEAIWTRWILIKFPYKFIPEKEYSKYSDDDKIEQKVKLEKLNIFEDLIQEKSGILNWAIEGLNRLLENKDYTETESTKNIRERWTITSAGSIAIFCEKFVRIQDDFSEDKSIHKIEFREKYKQYCENMHVPMQSDQKIKDFFEKKYHMTVKTRQHKDGKYYWDGIYWKEDVEE